MSRNGRWPSFSIVNFSGVHWGGSEILSVFLGHGARWRMCRLRIWTSIQVCVSLVLLLSSQNPPWRNSQLPEKVVSPLPSRPFVRRIVHQNRNMWMVVRVWTMPGYHLQSDDWGVQVNPHSELHRSNPHPITILEILFYITVVKGLLQLCPSKCTVMQLRFYDRLLKNSFMALATVTGNEYLWLSCSQPRSCHPVVFTPWSLSFKETNFPDKLFHF